MKKMMLSLLLLVLSLSSMAQLDKNNWLVGGSGSFYAYNQDYISNSLNFTAKYTSIDISAAAGYFIMDKLAIGLTPTFSLYKGKVISGGLTNQYYIAIGPLARYYFLKPERQFNLLTEVSYQLGIYTWVHTKDKGKYERLSLMIGPEIFFNSSVGLDFLMGYKSITHSIDNPPGEFKDIRKGFQLSVGLQFHLQKL